MEYQAGGQRRQAGRDAMANTTSPPQGIPLNEAILPLRSGSAATHSTSTTGTNTPATNASRSELDLPSALNGKGLAPPRDRSAERDANSHLKPLSANNTGSSVYSLRPPSSILPHRDSSPVPSGLTAPAAERQQEMHTGKSSNDEPVLLSANLSTLDMPFAEFSSSYSPMNPFVNSSSSAGHSRNPSGELLMSGAPGTLAPPVKPQYSGEHVQSPLDEHAVPGKIISQHTGSTNPFQREDRQDSTASVNTQATASSVGWNPGGDISMFDASASRNQRLGSGAEEGVLHRTWSEQTRWEAEMRNKRALDAQAAAERARVEEAAQQAEDEWWNEEAPASNPSSTHPVPASVYAAPNSQPPISRVPVPPPSSASRPQFPKVRSMIDAAIDSEESHQRNLQPPMLPARSGGSSSAARPGKSETYAIKQINWTSLREGGVTRKSPILVQNVNGPCPLLALVNTLILSTPKDVKTPLLDALSSREQISLGLLLDNVFEELMSERRMEASGKLPDVEQLYAFLMSLHTGMNINPRFVLNSESNQLIPDVPEPGLAKDTLNMFEITKELRLYDSFSVPLVHGWLPPVDHPAHEAVRRSAPSYEEVQNLLLREDELAQKMLSGGLTPEERQTMDDIIMIKDFLEQSPTQLTEYGLTSLSKTLLPGEFAILFRNDHFSTLYKHPNSGFLFTLVTDAGYATHEEIIWESLVDVTGEGCELCTGDFRPVSQLMLDAPSPRAEGSRRTSRNAPPSRHTATRSSMSGGRVSMTPPRTTESNESAQSPSREQEDHDFALALQIQMEEEERQVREAERRREDEQSQAFIRLHEEQTTSSLMNIPVAPPARQREREREPSGARLNRLPPMTSGPPATTPLTHRPVDVEAGVDVPPPTYEQAAGGPAYIPPPDHPAHPSAPIDLAQNASQNQSAYSQTNAGLAGGSQPTPPGLNAGPGLGGRRPLRPTATQLRQGAQRMLEEIQAGSNAQRRRQGGPAGYPGSYANEYPTGARRHPHDPNKDCNVM